MDVRPGEPERLGVTRLQRDLNFAAAVPENRDCSLLLYKKGSAKIEQEIPFTEEMRFGDVCAVRISQFPADTYEYNYQIDGKLYRILMQCSLQEESTGEKDQRKAKR